MQAQAQALAQARADLDQARAQLAERGEATLDIRDFSHHAVHHVDLVVAVQEPAAGR